MFKHVYLNNILRYPQANQLSIQPERCLPLYVPDPNHVLRCVLVRNILSLLWVTVQFKIIHLGLLFDNKIFFFPFIWTYLTHLFYLVLLWANGMFGLFLFCWMWLFTLFVFQLKLRVDWTFPYSVYHFVFSSLICEIHRWLIVVLSISELLFICCFFFSLFSTESDTDSDIENSKVVSFPITYICTKERVMNESFTALIVRKNRFLPAPAFPLQQCVCVCSFL